MKKTGKILMNDEARSAVRYSGPNDKQLLKALLSNETADIPSDRHIRWMAAELLKQRGWKLTHAYVGGKNTTLANAILLAPGEEIKGRHYIDGIPFAMEALR